MSTLVRRFWMPAEARFLQRSARERAIALVLAIGLAIGLGDRALLHPVQTRLDALQARAQVLATPDPNQAARQHALDELDRHRRQVSTELARVDRELDEMTAQLVPAPQMRQLLDGLLTGLPGLRLAELRSLAPQPVRPVSAGRSAPIAGQVYRHGFEVTIEGGYAEMVQYLERLERAPQRIFWKRAELDASHYPRNRLVFEIYTLSRESTWLIL